MATKILLKKSSTAGSVPLTGDLDQGELAVNLVDRKIYTKNNSGAIVKINGAYVDSVAPSTPAEGDIWYDTSTNYLKAYNGSSWINAGFTTLGEFGVTASAAELNILDGATLSTTELNYVDGVTSNIQTQLNNKAALAHTHAASDIVSGTLADARISESSVTQHEAALTITESQISDLQSYSLSTHNHTLDSLSNVTVTTNSSGEILKWNGSAWVNNTLAEAGISAVGHSHVAADITNLESTVEGYFSVSDTGGDGSLSYANGVFTYTGPSASEVQAHFTGGTYTTYNAGTFDVDFSSFTTNNITEGASNLYFTNERVDDRVSALIVGGNNITATYNDVAGTLTIDADNTGGFDLSNNDTDDLSEGVSNLYYTNARARAAVSVNDNGGDGSLTYNSTSGVITYTGPSSSEVRAHLSGGTGVTYNNGTGVIAIGQEVATTSDVTFNDITTTGTIYGPATMTLDPSAHGDNTGTVVIAGNLTVNGTTTSVNSNEVNIGDSIIVLNSDETGTPSQNAGIEVERGTAANVAFLWVEADDAWDMGNYNLQNVVIDGGSY